MKDKLMFRTLNEEDYETICAWWKQWKWAVLPRTALPNNGKGGFIVEKNGEPIVSAFLYLTNSSIAYIEWIVSNPSYREADRKNAIELLINQCEEFCKTISGVDTILSIGRHKHLIETHKKLGWQVDERPSHEIIKNI